MRRTIVIAIISLCVSGPIRPAAAADDAPTAPDASQKKQRLRELFVTTGKSHDRLKSGSFHAVDKFRQAVEGKLEENPLEVWELDCTFDRPRELVRYDTTIRIGTDPGRGVRFASAKGRCFIHDAGSGEATVYLAEKRPDMSVATQPFEIRQVGLGPLYRFQRRPGFEQMCRVFEESYAFNDETANADGTIDLKFSAPGKHLDILLRLDSKHGHLPVLVEKRSRISGGLLAATETKWESKNEAWVPVLMKCHEREQAHMNHRELRFEWNNVNGAVDDARFTLEGMGLKKGDFLIDTTVEGAKPVLKRVGQD